MPLTLMGIHLITLANHNQCLVLSNHSNHNKMLRTKKHNPMPVQIPMPMPTPSKSKKKKRPGFMPSSTQSQAMAAQNNASNSISNSNLVTSDGYIKRQPKQQQQQQPLQKKKKHKKHKHKHKHKSKQKTAETAVAAAATETVVSDEERAKRRQLRQKLSLAKIQMSVLRARLGLEQMQSTPNNNANPPDSAASMDTDDDHHRRLSSVSQVYRTMESVSTFEDDIKEAISKVESLAQKVTQHENNESVVVENKATMKKIQTENQSLLQQLQDIRMKYIQVRQENSKITKELQQSKDHEVKLKKENSENVQSIAKLKLLVSQKTKTNANTNTNTKTETAIKSKTQNAEETKENTNANDSKNASTAQKTQSKHEPRKSIAFLDKAISGFKPATILIDPLEKYSKMKNLGMTIVQITAKMQKANVSKEDIVKWRKENTKQTKEQSLMERINAQEQKYAKYDKMRKMKMPDNTIRNKMRFDGFKPNEIEMYLDPEKAAAVAKEEKEKAEKLEKMKKYERMKKMGMPENTIRNKMRFDGFKPEEIEQYLHPQTAEEEEEDDDDDSKAEPDPKLAKYARMKKMGMPIHVITNKMRLDGVDKAVIAEFENPGASKKKTVKAADPRLAKYERMKKMNMPIHVITNKMRLDGVEKALIAKFENPDADNSDCSDDDENEAAKVDLNIPALAKYNRMKKMGMPTHVITNKMKLDGIDKNLIEAFANPGGTKKKKKGFKALFHRKKPSIAVKTKIKPSCTMKRFHWKTVDYKLARKSVWRSLDEAEIKIDIPEFEEMFKIPEKKNKLFGGGNKAKAEVKKTDSIKFVTPKRQYNVELKLKRLKFVGSVLNNDIRVMDDRKMDEEMLSKVVEMVPTPEEQEMAKTMGQQHSKKINKFGVVEKFFYDLYDIWHVQRRCELWMFKTNFAHSIQEKIERVILLNAALASIRDSKALIELFKIVLAFGNYMNGGRRTGQAYGFGLDTLRILTGMKANDGKTSLLMYVYKYAAANKPIALQFASDLETIPLVSRINVSELESDIASLDKELSELPNELKQFQKENKNCKTDQFNDKMVQFTKAAALVMENLKERLKTMKETAKQIAESFAFELETVNGFLEMFNEFLKDWSKSKVKWNNMEARRKKAALKKQKQEDAQARLQKKLSKRSDQNTLKRKRILKDGAQVKKENNIRSKLKFGLRAHVRRKTEMQKAGFFDDSDSEEEEEPAADQTPDAHGYANASNQIRQFGVQGRVKKGVSFNPDVNAREDNAAEAIDRSLSKQSIQDSYSNSSDYSTLRIVKDSSLPGLEHNHSEIYHGTPTDDAAHLDPHNGSANLEYAHSSPNRNLGQDTDMTHEELQEARELLINEDPSAGHKGKKRRAKTPKVDRDGNKISYQHRGKAGMSSYASDSRYNYSSKHNVLKRKASPAAKHFGNYFDQNYAPLSVLPGKYKKGAVPKAKVYKKGHVRRETRLKSAFKKLAQEKRKSQQLDLANVDLGLGNNRNTASAASAAAGSRSPRKHKSKSKNKHKHKNQQQQHNGRHSPSPKKSKRFKPTYVHPNNAGASAATAAANPQQQRQQRKQRQQQQAQQQQSVPVQQARRMASPKAANLYQQYRKSSNVPAAEPDNIEEF